MYNRGLSEQEVKENYNKAVAYHNTLQNTKNQNWNNNPF